MKKNFSYSLLILLFINSINLSTQVAAQDCNTNGTAFAQVPTQISVAWNAGNAHSNRQKPALGVWEPGDIPGTEIMCVSDDDGNGLHYYNSRQVWNADMTKLMIGSGSIDKNRLLDATNNYALLPTRIPLNSHRVWSNTNPDLIYGIRAKTSFSAFNVTTGETTALYARPGNTEINFRSKGNLPGNDSKIALYEPSTNTIISYNIQTRSVIAEIVWPYGNINVGGGHVTYDWTGNWIVVGMNEAPLNIYRMKPDLTEITQVHNEVSHWDNAYNTNGESVRLQTRGNGSVQVVNYDNPGKNYISPVFGGGDPANGQGC